jgi:hypothetical protein
LPFPNGRSCISHANPNFFHANVRNKSGWYRNPADSGNLTAGLLACGLSSKEVAKIMGGNWLRYMGKDFSHRPAESALVPRL